jgi:predicted PurR-regulated permease PerM
MRFGLIFTMGGLIVWLLKDVVLVIFAAALFAVLLHGLARLLSRSIRLPYGAALTIVALILLGLVTGLGWYAGPNLADEAAQLRDKLGQAIGQLHGTLGKSSWGRFALHQLPTVMGGDKQEGGGNAMPVGLAGSVAGFFESIFGALGTFAVILVAGLYFAANPQLYVDGVMRLLPPEHRRAGRRLAAAAGDALWHWTAGQAVDMLFVGIVSVIGLTMLNVPLAPVLGILAGLMNFVPYIGAIVGFIPAILIALSQGPQHALSVAILYAVIQGFEGNVLAPIIQRRAAHLAPALTILSQTTIGALFGIPGLMLATPLAAALVAVVQVLEPPEDQAAARGSE